MDLSTFEIIVNTLLIIIGVYQIVLSLLHKMDLISKSMVTGYCALGSLLLGLGLLSLGLIEHLGSTFFGAINLSSASVFRYSFYSKG